MTSKPSRIEISKELLRGNRSLVIINIYDPPANSSTTIKRKELNLDGILDELFEFLAKLKDVDIVLAGDFNARIGALNFIPRFENWKDSRDLNVDANLRGSRDSVTNARGKK